MIISTGVITTKVDRNRQSLLPRKTAQRIVRQALDPFVVGLCLGVGVVGFARTCSAGDPPQRLIPIPAAVDKIPDGDPSETRQTKDGTSRRETVPIEPRMPTAKQELEGLQSETVIPAAEEQVIDLPTALRLAETANPAVALGREAICEALALQTAARGLMLPTLTAGTMYHLHQGRLQTSFGEIRSLNSQSIYIGGGTRTLAAETVAIPAVRIFSHLGDAVFAPLAAGQVVSSRTSNSLAVQNTVLLSVVRQYLELVGAEAALEALHESEQELRQVVQATAAFAKTGQGRLGDFHRARSEALLLHAEEQEAQEEVAVASARLSRLLHLDPSIRLRTPPGGLVMVELVDPGYPLPALIQLAQSARPEIATFSAEIAASQYRVRQENTRPLLPLLSVGFSGGGFGGGSNRSDLGVSSFFQRMDGRTDFDVFAVWTLQNLGAGNLALQRQRRSERDQTIAARGLMINRIGREVGDAYQRVETYRQQVDLARRRLKTAATGAREELTRTRGGEGLPIEAINSVNLHTQARRALLEAVLGYDLAQFELFVAIGQTPDGAVPDPRTAPKPVEQRQ